MRLRIILSTIAAVIVSMSTQAKSLFPDSETASNEVELGVEGVGRLCPAGLWDHWTFRDIIYDKESNTVMLVIQLNSWNEKRHGKDVTDEDVRRQAEWIVENIMEGYNDLISAPRIMCDGDFMVYLSLGTLLKQMEKDGANLRIMLLKPDYTNQAYGETPMTLSPEQLREAISKK